MFQHSAKSLFACGCFCLGGLIHHKPFLRHYRQAGHFCWREIEVTSWLVSADDFSSRVARGANERVSAANEWVQRLLATSEEKSDKRTNHEVICLFYTYWDFKRILRKKIVMKNFFDARNCCSTATFCNVFFLVLSFSCSEMKSSTDTSKSLNLDAILFDEKWKTTRRCLPVVEKRLIELYDFLH